jgi:DNA polymerase V
MKNKTSNNPIKPLFKSNGLSFFSVSVETETEIPFVKNTGVSAGFPSPAADFTDGIIDFNKYLIKKPSTTFCVVVDGNSMTGAGINDKDILIVDRSLEPTNGKIAVCVINNEFTLKRLKVVKKELWLMPENDSYPAIKVSEFEDFEVWGIVTFSIKSH